MKLHFSISVSFFIISITLYQIPICFCVNYEESCRSSFHCANLGNIGYPFRRSEREDFCGHPEFELDCDGEHAVITINSESYRVLQVNYSDHSLRVVRNDFWSNPCPTSFRNISIDFTFFQYRSDSRDLTLYYDCPSPPFSLPYIDSTQFKCSINSTQMVNYFLLKVPEFDGTSTTEETGACKSTVTVPILESQVKILEKNSSEENLKAAIDNGFGLVWEANNKECYGCRNSGGQCGYNTRSSKFACYCREGPVSSACGSSKYQCSSNSYQSMKNSVFDVLVLHRLEFEKLVASVNLD